MSFNRLAIVDARETICFGTFDGELRQWIMITVDNGSQQALDGSVEIEAGAEVVATSVTLIPGVHEYRCYAPTLWPNRAAEAAAAVRLEAGDSVVSCSVSVGFHRPWTFYLLSDGCTDITWVYDTLEAEISDDAAVTEAELNLADETSEWPASNRNHYNLVHCREVEFYLEEFPDKADRLFDAIRRGTITLNPFYNMCNTNNLTLEGLIRHFYAARRWADEQCLEMGYANHQETPTITWGAATVLAQCGIKHMITAILPYECPWAQRLEEPPIFLWEGPDGSQVLVCLRNGDYVEGRFVLRDLRATNTALHDATIPRYEVMGDQYPFSAIGLLGCYGDLAPNTKDLPAKKVATIAAYNAQGWEYPKLVNAGHKQFWDDIDTQVAERGIELHVSRGDYGTSWEAWPACLANDFVGYRRAQERAGVADSLSAVLSTIDAAWHGAHSDTIANAWRHLTYLADHAWNGSNEKNLALNAALRREWQMTANREFDSVIASGLDEVSKRVPTGDDSGVMVFNSLGWARDSVVHLSEVRDNSRLVDVATGKAVPSQVVPENCGAVTCFYPGDVPAVGYRVFQWMPRDSEPTAGAWQWNPDEATLEGPFYKVKVSTVTGGIESLYDKLRGKELVDPESPYHANQCLYVSEGVEHTPGAATAELGQNGPVFAEVIVRSSLKNTNVVSTITLYAQHDRVDLRNELEKAVTSEKQELDFAFPFSVPDRQYRFEAPGAIITPGDDQLPGSGQAVTAVRHFVDVFNSDYGVTLSQADSGLVEFGHRTTTEDPVEPDMSNSTVFAMALDNTFDWNEAIRDQAGDTHFVFRYSLCGHAGNFDPVAAVRFGWDDNNALLSVPLPAGQQGVLPAGAHSFVSISKANVVLAGLKTAEEDGLILRLWECAGDDTTAVVSLEGLGSLAAARRTDLMEHDLADLMVTGNAVEVNVSARGVTTIRLILE